MCSTSEFFSFNSRFYSCIFSSLVKLYIEQVKRNTACVTFGITTVDYFPITAQPDLSLMGVHAIALHPHCSILSFITPRGEIASLRKSSHPPSAYRAFCSGIRLIFTSTQQPIALTRLKWRDLTCSPATASMPSRTTLLFASAAEEDQSCRGRWS